MGEFTVDTVTYPMNQMDDTLTTDVSTPTGDYEDYGFMCDSSSVREFRGLYEPPLYWTIAIIGGLGNLAVVWIYVHFRQRLKTMTDVYLLNLAVADLLFLGTLPLWATEATYGWRFGIGLCKVNSALYKINLFSSMLLLTCISVDRYVVIVQTTKAQNSKQQRLRCSKLVCTGVWLLAVLLATPEFIFSTAKKELYGDVAYCSPAYPGHMKNHVKILVLSLQMSMGFCLPFLIMTFCYSVIICTLLKTRSFEKHKALRVILVVVAVFVVSQLPYTGVLVKKVTQASNMTDFTDCDEKKRFDIIDQVLKSLAYTHACLNPFLYAFVGVRFRKDVVRLLQAYHCWPSQGKVSKLHGGSMRASVMSDTDTTQALSL